MILAFFLAAFTLSWDAVTQDCRGGQEPLPPVYAVWTYRATVIGSYTGPDGSPWPLYSRVQGEEWTPATSLPIADPDIGGLVAYGDPVAVDVAGNRSDEGCL